ncbi:hypothetical protein VNO78_20400 [Psophocarpus tetragonolobus]|uniref:Uncharacterized protein n=1 Tax=Psophocarpus tetragonolobus TaxID=3891 RepID=A0AAN9XH43_PSOTE
MVAIFGETVDKHRNHVIIMLWREHFGQDLHEGVGRLGRATFDTWAAMCVDKAQVCYANRCRSGVKMQVAQTSLTIAELIGLCGNGGSGMGRSTQEDFGEVNDKAQDSHILATIGKVDHVCGSSGGKEGFVEVEVRYALESVLSINNRLISGSRKKVRVGKKGRPKKAWCKGVTEKPREGREMLVDGTSKVTRLQRAELAREMTEVV